MKSNKTNRVALDIVMVEWHDARFFPGTYTQDECRQHRMCRFNSLGYLITKDNTTTLIAGECNDEGDYRDITLIPTGSIVAIKELVSSV